MAVALLACCACAGVPRRAVSAPAALEPSLLVGRWYVIASTFPMWEERRDVTFGYGVLGLRTLSDQVGYFDASGPHSIVGVDTQHQTVPTHFTWRGEGLLSLFTSEWDVAAVDEQKQWVVLTFGATLATPAGFDVIARTRAIDEATFQAAIDRASADETVKQQVPSLFRVTQSP